MSNSHTFDRVVIVGVGLIGGSLAAAIKKFNQANSVVGVGRRLDRIQAAVDSGLLDEVTDDLQQAAAGADLMVFCTPVDQITAGVRRAAASARPGTLITDVGSVKGPICRELAHSLPGRVEFLGSHPIAGSEKQGFEYADPNLFRDRVCVLTPEIGNSAGAIERLTSFWQGVGACVHSMSPTSHDRALAETSHFPHLIAAALAASLSEENRPFAATGFRDTTRIAAGDPGIWTSIFLQNADEVVACLGSFSTKLEELTAAIHERDPARLAHLLDLAKRNRDALNRPIREETDS